MGPETARAWSPADRRAIYDAQIDALAALHAFDPAAIGLGDYGRPGNYFERQVGRWTKQYRASEIEPIAAMDRLIEFLPATLPPEGPTRIVHGDFRLDNLIMAPDAPQVRAVLDWELSTLGDPMADFSYLLIAWVIPANQRNGLAGRRHRGSGHPVGGRDGRALCAPDRGDVARQSGLAVRLQPVPAGRHLPGHRRSGPRRHGRLVPCPDHGRPGPDAGRRCACALRRRPEPSCSGSEPWSRRRRD